MIRKLLLLPVIVLMLISSAIPAYAQGKRMRVYGVMFYNLENLFDSINNNGKYDEYDYQQLLSYIAGRNE